MIVLTPEQVRQVADAAEAAYPQECCGLLVGRGRRLIRISRVVPAANLHPPDPMGARGDRFELDPRTRFEVERDLRSREQATAANDRERIVGHYHSHPTGSARPSATDLDQAWEPELVWLIVGVIAASTGPGGQVVQMQAYRLDRHAQKARPTSLSVIEESACNHPHIPT
jgi:proteasome lid subunit RPN8/RPN11